jgi:hypothetical protein
MSHATVPSSSVAGRRSRPHLYRVSLGQTALSYISAGVHSILDNPKDKKLPDDAGASSKP